MTTTRWKDRFHGHRGCINRRKFGITLYEHFLNVGHTYHHCKVQVIFVCDSNCDDINKTLLTVEEYYMVKLATVYPYGLNDKLESKNIVLSSFDFRDFHKLNTPFFTFPSVRRSLSHDHRKNSSQCISLPIASETIDTVFNLYKTNKLHELYILLRSLSHSHIDDCLLNIEDYVKIGTVKQLLLAYRSHFIVPTKKVNKDNDCVYCPIPLMHKAMEDVGVDSILKWK